METRTLFAPMLAVIAIAALTPAASATVARAVPFDQKVEQADAIILGRVTDTRSELSPDGKFIVTHTTFEVGQSLKGQAPQHVTVTTPGGSVGSLNQRSIGVPEFAEGEEKVLFLSPARQGVITPLYFDQGTYDVDRTSGTQPVIRPVRTNLVLIDTQTGLATDSGESPTTLAAFRGSINRVMARHQAQGLGSSDPALTSRPWTDRASDWMSEHGLLLALALVAAGVASIPLLRRR